MILTRASFVIHLLAHHLAAHILQLPDRLTLLRSLVLLQNLLILSMVLKSIVVLDLSIKPWPLLRQVMVLLLRLHLVNHLHEVSCLPSYLLVFECEHVIVSPLGLRSLSEVVPGTILALVLHLDDYLFQLCDSLILSVHFSHLILKLLFFDGQQLS